MTPTGPVTDAGRQRLTDRAAGALRALGVEVMAFWLYMSGTTGSPKAAVHCHRTLPDGQ